MTPDPDPLGPDGTVRLRCYLPLADTHWFSAGCQGLRDCGHVAPISVQAAIRIMGTGEATVRQLGQRLRCSRCGGHQVGIVVCSDPRPAWAREHDGPAPQTVLSGPAPSGPFGGLGWGW